VFSLPVLYVYRSSDISNNNLLFLFAYYPKFKITYFKININLLITFSLIQLSVVQIEYVWVLISLWRFLFAAQLKKIPLNWLKKLEQRSHKCVGAEGGNL
jgi:hypothetical protein